MRQSVTVAASKLPLIFAALVVGMLVACGGCGGGNEPQGLDLVRAMRARMTGEELAYNDETEYIGRAIAEELFKKPWLWIDAETENIILPGKFDGDWQSVKMYLESILPPNTYERIHQRNLSVVQALIENDKSKAKLLAEQNIDGAEAWMKDFLARPVVKRDGPLTKFVYTPPFLPIGQIVADRTGFSVETGDSINTPVGSFGMTKSQPKGVTRLVIRANGQQRMFKVDRPFQVFVPTDYGVDISGDGDRKLIIDVRKK